MFRVARFLTLSALIVTFFAVSAAPASARQSHPLRGPGYHIVDRVPMTDGWWDYATFDPVHRRVFVSRGDGVFKLDTVTGLMDPQVIPGSEGRGVIVLPGGNEVLEDMAGYSAAVLFDAADGHLRKMFSLRQAPDAAVWEPVGRRAWVIGSHGEVYLLDPVTLKQTARIDLGERLEFVATDGRGRVFVNGVDSASVIAVDAASLKVIGRWKMKGCKEPTGMAYAAAANVVLSVCTNKMLNILDATTGRELETLPVGEGADAVIYDASTREVFVPSAVDGLLTVLTVSGPEDVRVLEQDATQVGTRTGAIDPQTGTLYLPTARFGPVNKLGWSEALPRTVELLVMKPATAR
jgi:DNA-binding beta-propeller fold protein YncE